MANQIAITTIARMIALHTTGVTCFELPLRGEIIGGVVEFLIHSVALRAKLAARSIEKTARTLSQSEAPHARRASRATAASR